MSTSSAIAVIVYNLLQKPHYFMSTLKKSHVFAFINVYYFLNVQLQKNVSTDANESCMVLEASVASYWSWLQYYSTASISDHVGTRRLCTPHITHLALYATLLCFSTTHSKSTGDAAERNDNTGSRDTSTVHRRKSRYFTFWAFVNVLVVPCSQLRPISVFFSSVLLRQLSVLVQFW